MRELIAVAMQQLWKLTVLGPAWLLTPQGQKTLFSRQTLRRVVMSVAFAMILAGVAQTLPFDLALIFAGDILAYAEIAAIAWIATASGVLTQAMKAAAHAGLQALRRLRPAGARQPRKVAARRRRPRRTAARPPNDDSPRTVGWLRVA